MRILHEALQVAVREDLDEEDPAYKLRDWLLSTEGQAVVAESGYVPLP
jgi:ABC-type phosphate transport system substrate-binding protein